MSSSFFAVIRQSLGMAAPVSRKIAKERLSIMLVHQRNSDAVASIDMTALQKEVAMVVAKYIRVAEDKPAHMSCKLKPSSLNYIYYIYSSHFYFAVHRHCIFLLIIIKIYTSFF